MFSSIRWVIDVKKIKINTIFIKKHFLGFLFLFGQYVIYMYQFLCWNLECKFINPLFTYATVTPCFRWFPRFDFMSWLTWIHSCYFVLLYRKFSLSEILCDDEILWDKIAFIFHHLLWKWWWHYGVLRRVKWRTLSLHAIFFDTKLSLFT